MIYLPNDRNRVFIIPYQFLEQLTVPTQSTSPPSILFPPHSSKYQPQPPQFHYKSSLPSPVHHEVIYSHIIFLLSMKTQHRLMRVVEIENNYQKHRERLLSIQHISARKKKTAAGARPNETSTVYRQSKLKADIFSYKEKHEQIQHENMILLNKIEKQYEKREKKEKQGKSLARSQSSHSVRSVHSARDIQSENVRIYQKINNTKSIYSKIRKEGTQSNGVKLNTSKQEILHLLVNQLGVKPSVLLPTLRKIKPSRSTHNKTLDLRAGKSLRMHLDNLDETTKKHSLTNPVLPKK